MDLFELGVQYDCIKCRYKYKESAWHFTKEVYPRYFESRRHNIKTLLEIGVHKGGSLRMWRDYFPNAQIYGVDILPDSFFEEERIKVFIGDQARPKLLAEVEEVGPFDIIIDDGGHHFHDQMITFEMLWPTLKSDGIYVIEDVVYSKFRMGQYLIKYIEGRMIRSIKSICYYDNIIVLEKQEPKSKKRQ